MVLLGKRRVSSGVHGLESDAIIGVTGFASADLEHTLFVAAQGQVSNLIQAAAQIRE
jgi:hypothetical protein